MVMIGKDSLIPTKSIKCKLKNTINTVKLAYFPPNYSIAELLQHYELFLLKKNDNKAAI